MTTVQGFDQLGKKVAKQVHTFDRRIRQVAAVGNQEVALTVVAHVATHLGGQSINMRNVGRGRNGKARGAKVAIVARKDSTYGKDAYVAKMTGPAHLIERPIKEHTIIGYSVGRLGKGKGSRSKEAKHAAKQALYNALFGGVGGGHLHLGQGPDDWRTGPIDHRGVKNGKHPFEKGVREVQGQNELRIYQRGVRVALKESFG